MRTTAGIGIAVALLIAMLGCGAPSLAPEPSPASPIVLDLVMAKAPRVGEAAIVTCSIKSAFDAPASVATIELPEGAVLLDGNLEWSGDLRQDVPVQLSATIRFVEEGEWVIKAVAKHVIDEQNWWGDEDYIYLTVTEESGSFESGTAGTSQPTEKQGE